jgi:hypothetical protein
MEFFKLNSLGSISITEYDVLVQKALNLRSYILSRIRAGQTVTITSEAQLQRMERD